jgi:cell fate (sporulation/competence/biofilm development) regulator YlbF (YheA/YmcA/DUF963 family)
MHTDPDATVDAEPATGDADADASANAEAGAEATPAAEPVHAGVEVEAEAEDVDVEALGRRLGEAIAETPEYREYEECEAAVAADEEAQERIAAFERERSEYVLARQTGRATDEALQSLKASQRALHELPVMEEYLAAQEALVDRLEAINEAISEPLSVDFGGEAGGCCQD